LQQFPAEVSSETRWRDKALAAIDDVALQRGRDLLAEAATTAPGLVTGDSTSPWTGARLKDAAAARAAIDLAQRLATVRWPAFLAALTRVEQNNAIRATETIAEVNRVVELLHRVEDVLALYRPDVFDDELASRAASLAPAKGRLSSLWGFLTNAAFREARAAMLSKRHDTKISMTTLAAEAQRALDCQEAWTRLSQSNTRPHPPKHHRELATALETLLQDLEPLLAVFPPSKETRLERLMKWLPALASDSVTPYQVVRIGEIERELRKLGGSADGVRCLRHGLMS
jgi:hypothetical protein